MADPVTATWQLFLGFGAVVGGSIGSFLNVVVWRLPLGRSLSHPPSACPHCGHKIRPWHNLPVFGWLMLRGRCHDCSEPISARYPIVEMLCGLLWVLLFLNLLPEPQVLAEPAQLVGFCLYGAYFSALLAISLIDLDHFIVPDTISLPLIPIGLAAVAMLDAWGVGRVAFPDAVLGALVGGGGMWALAKFGELLYGREALGMGDVKLMAAIGAWQGLHPTLLLTLFGGATLGSVIGIGHMIKHGRDRQAKVPFGPFLCAGALISWLAGDLIWARMLGL